MHDAADAVRFTPDQILAGRYRLTRPLGEGGLGVVWEARQITTDKAVALKVLKTRESAGIERLRFVREARVAAGLSHRNIVQVFDFWDQEDEPAFLVMELLHGETLGAVLTRGVPPLVDTLDLLLPVANALAFAHAMGVVHRDLKPENVFLARALDDALDVKVLDFGLAKPITPDADMATLTSTGALMGTPFYMAPEQVYGEKNVDVSADVWAFGVLLYECLTGMRPFVGENFGQIFRSITQTSPRPVHELAPHVPSGLSTMIARMLAQEAGARPSMSEVASMLGAFARGEISLPTRRISSQPPAALPSRTVALSPPAMTARTGPMTPPAAIAASTTTASSVNAPVSSATSKKRAVVATIAGSGALIAALVLTFALRGARDRANVAPPPSAAEPAADERPERPAVAASATGGSPKTEPAPVTDSTNDDVAAPESHAPSAAPSGSHAPPSARPSSSRKAEAAGGRNGSRSGDPLNDRW